MRIRIRRRPLHVWLLIALAALGLVWLFTGGPARGAEFVTPPGIDLQSQEAVLKARVTRIARDLVGDALVDVEASVRYVRTDGTTGERIKLPGVSHYIVPSAGGGTGTDIVAGQVRVRQILVVVANSVETAPDVLARELRTQGQFDPAHGDLVRVVKVPEAGKAEQGPGMAAVKPKADDGLTDDAKKLSDRLKREQDRQREQQELGKMIAQGSLSEAQSTTFLIKARQAYFNGNYDRALDQILQSISQNPNNPQAYAMLGSLYYAVDWKQLALKYWEKSLTLDPDNREVQDLVSKLRSSPTQ